MNKKIIGIIASGIIITSMIVGVETLIEENDTLNSTITKIKQENNDKTIEIRNLKEEINLKEIDINLLKEERKVLYNKIEELKKNNNYPNNKISFNQCNLKSNSGVDAKRLNKVLEDTGLAGLGSTYVDAEKTYGINAIFLTALTAQESGWGNSNRARTQNNLSGYAVYSDDSDGKTFSSKSDSIYATAKLLSNDYLNSKGKYYKGVDIFSVNTTYCPVDGYDWSNKITSIANNLVREINSL